ncbi:MAG: DUF3592 domain-containing protein [Myxococcales bacterium]|nr:DUF3592 domain-containing protein [Myxococcales bacterium]
MRRFGDVLLSLAVLGTGVGLIAVFGGLMSDLVSSITWVSTPCSVGEVWVERPDEQRSLWVVRGSFTYPWDGENRVSARLALDTLEFNEPGYAESFVSQRGLEEAVTCLVNPRRPQVAVLMRSKSRLETAVWSAGVFLTAGIVVLGVWLLAASLQADRSG